MGAYYRGLKAVKNQAKTAILAEINATIYFVLYKISAIYWKSLLMVLFVIEKIGKNYIQVRLLFVGKLKQRNR